MFVKRLSTVSFEGRIYRIAVIAAMLYGTQYWVVRNQHENKVSVAEMRILRWMCGNISWDKIRNYSIRERVGVASVVEMVQTRPRWFEHVVRRPIDFAVRRVVKSLKAEEYLEKLFRKI